MRPFTHRTSNDARTATAGRHSEQVLHDILTGPDTAHRRELEILLEERGR